MLKIRKALEGGATVYLRAQEHDDAIVKLVPVGDGIVLFTAWVKFKGRPEYQVDTKATIVLDAMLAEEEASEKEFLAL